MSSVYIVGVDCLWRERRRSMTDDDFWADVYGDPVNEAQDLDECFGIDAPAPCPECGSAVACGYDSFGRPMIHVVEENTDGEPVESWSDFIDLRARNETPDAGPGWGRG